MLVAALPPDLPRLDEIRVDPAVLAATLALSLLVGVACGLLPALLARRANPADGLRVEGRSGGGSGSARARRLVTVAEVATALVLWRRRRSASLEPRASPRGRARLRRARRPDDGGRAPRPRAIRTTQQSPRSIGRWSRAPRRCRGSSRLEASATFRFRAATARTAISSKASRPRTRTRFRKRPFGRRRRVTSGRSRFRS